MFLEAQKTLDQEQRGEEIQNENKEIEKLARMERVLQFSNKTQSSDLTFPKEKYSAILDEIQRMQFLADEIVTYHKRLEKTQK